MRTFTEQQVREVVDLLRGESSTAAWWVGELNDEGLKSFHYGQEAGLTRAVEVLEELLTHD